MWGSSGVALWPFPISKGKMKVSNTFQMWRQKEILCAQHSFGPCGPSLQDVVEAKTLAMIKEGFPGPWDEQEQPALKKDSLCAFGVCWDIGQGQSYCRAGTGTANRAAGLGPASA